MATKMVCDGCGEEIKGANVELWNEVIVKTGPTEKKWDACKECRLEVEHIFLGSSLATGGLDLIEAP